MAGKLKIDMGVPISYLNRQQVGAAKKVTLVSVCMFLFSLMVFAQKNKEESRHAAATSDKGTFPLVHNTSAASIFIDTADAKVVSIAANAVASDIELVSGARPSIVSTLTTNNGYLIIAGTIGRSVMIDALIKAKKLDVSKIKNKWEGVTITIISSPLKGVNKALVIAGSDSRGTAYGLFEISRIAGVSPWVWWADVHPEKKSNISISLNKPYTASPAVKYRGIFINDEDWGLQPWAAKTLEPEPGDIGPKTYAKVFELLLRLKANLIWPAMHPSTKAFYHYPGNKEVAADYSIIVGSSHAEPMLRNNVGEWDEKTMGHFNYITNKATVQKYWEDRVKESSDNNAMYTLGMRGVHDSGMEGVESTKEAVPLLEQIFKDQRGMLQKYVDKDVTTVPQVLTVYKEMLDVYDSNLKVPDDVAIVWPDDNYGYIQRLNNKAEQARAGGGGVYYHTSYWGRPHDYLWLNSTHPALIREEMMKAYEMKASKVWVLNVGDIKPHEYNIEMFMDMAFNPRPFQDSKYSRQHLLDWAGKIFGRSKGERIQKVLWQYYQLAFERKPEFMGWSQTEPTTQTNYTGYNHFYYGDEAQKRVDQYEELEKEAKALRLQIDRKNADAFYQLVYYPVVCASLMNKKFLYRDKSYLYAKQNRLSAFDYAVMSKQTYDSIVSETAYFNDNLANGKWKNVMSMAPRNLPVYQPPVLPEIGLNRASVWSVAPEGFVTNDSSLHSSGGKLQLPPFSRRSNKKFFIDIFLSDEKVVNWSASTSAAWISLSRQSGTLSPDFGNKQLRIWVSVNWAKVPGDAKLNGSITFTANQKTITVAVLATNVKENKLKRFKGFIESDGYVSIYASNFSRQRSIAGRGWKVVEGLGHTGKVMEALPLQASNKVDTTKFALLKLSAPFVEYDFYTFTPAAPEVTVYTLPTHPLNKEYSMRYAVSIDDANLKIVDFKTVGRSEEWKQNVLRNSAVKKISSPVLAAGKHRLKIHMIDPGVIVDRIVINMGSLKKSYGRLDETKNGFVVQ
jgi:hypothetical protein